MNERELAGLRGPVRTCATERERTDASVPEGFGPARSRTVESYREDGQLIERRCYAEDGIESATICRYDEDGRRTELEERRFDGRRERLVYRYDEQGRLERIIQVAGEEQRLMQSFQYETDGSKTRTDYFPQDSQNGGLVVMTMFDSAGRTIRRVTYDRDDRVLRRGVYDDRGLLTAEGEWDSGGLSETNRTKYRYDEDGREVEHDTRNGDFGGYRAVTRYNAQGDPEERRMESFPGILSDDRGDQSWTERFEYEYDARGNWIERTCRNVLGSGEVAATIVERRSVTYYPERPG